MTYSALRVLAALVALLPRAALAPFGAGLGWIAGSLLRVRRAAAVEAMRRAGVTEPAGAARRMYRDLGHGLAELLWLAGAPKHRHDEVLAGVTIDEEAQAALERALAGGPVVLFASHTGNWELAAGAAARFLEARGRRLAVVAKAIHARGVDRLIRTLRAELGVDVIAPQGALSSARRALAAGAVVAMPIDQCPERAEHGVWVPFLGAPALVDRAPATLARRAGATVLVVATERAGDGHRVRLLDVVRPSEEDDGILATTRAATLRLDAFVRERPETWLWLHRRWKTPAPVRLVATEQAG